MHNRFGVILPHTLIFGGVKRFLEIGNVLVDHGIEFIIFTREGTAPDWFHYKGLTIKLDQLENYELDLLIITHPDYLSCLLKSRSTIKAFYLLIERKLVKPILKYPGIRIFANSSNIYQYLVSRFGIKPFKAFGGVNTILYPYQEPVRQPGRPFTVLAYGRLSRRRKGTSLIIKACENLYRQGHSIKLLLFDTPVDEKSEKLIRNFTCQLPFEFIVGHPVKNNAELFHRADVFISAEKEAGWSNTSAEAMAAGTPLIATRSGTKDFLLHQETGLKVLRHSFFIRRAILKLMKDPSLAKKLAENGRKKIEEFTWEKLGVKILRYVREELQESITSS